MSDRVERFEVEGTPEIMIRVPVGDVRVMSGSPGAIVVKLRGRDRAIEHYLVEQQGNTITVEPDRNRPGGLGSVDVIVEVAEPPMLRTRSSSGDLVVDTDLAELTVDTAAGDVRVGTVLDGVRAKTASGNLRFGRVGGRLSVASAAGDLTVEEVGRSFDAKVASGDVRVGKAAGSVDIKSAAGDVQIGAFDGDDLNVKTLSGDVVVGVAAGRRFKVSFNSLNGTIKTDFPVGSGGDGSLSRLTIKSMSGSISIRPAS